MTRLIYNNDHIICPVCGSEKLFPVFVKDSMPIYNLEKHYNRKSALNAKRGALNFYFCYNCLFAFNASFDPSQMDYSIEYESSRSHSKYFNDYIDKVCQDLNHVFDVSKKTIVEVGCGDRQFLRKLRGKYKFKGYGFDPSLITNTIGKSYDGLKFVRGYYSYASLKFLPDIIILRHILEHQPNPHSFFDKITPKNKPSKKVSIYIEVPAWEWIIDNNWIFAFSYEHCSYYSQYSIEYALRLHNFYPQKISFTFNNEYLQYYGINFTLFKTLEHFKTKPKKSIIEKSELFKEKIPVLLQELKIKLKGLLNESALWGAAGKGTVLLNLLNISHNQLEYVVDSNPKRHNNYIPGTGQRVVAPEFLKELRPKYILLTNSAYRAEITSQIAALGLDTELVLIDQIIKKI